MRTGTDRNISDGIALIEISLLFIYIQMEAIVSPTGWPETPRRLIMRMAGSPGRYKVPPLRIRSLPRCGPPSGFIAIWTRHRVYHLETGLGRASLVPLPAARDASLTRRAIIEIQLTDSWRVMDKVSFTDINIVFRSFPRVGNSWVGNNAPSLSIILSLKSINSNGHVIYWSVSVVIPPNLPMEWSDHYALMWESICKSKRK